MNVVVPRIKVHSLTGVSTSKVRNSLGVLDTPFERVRGGGVDFGRLIILFPVLLPHRVRNSLRFVEKTGI